MELQLQPETDVGDGGAVADEGADPESSIESDSESDFGGAEEPPQFSPAYQPLYPGAQITEETGIMLILSLANRYRLTHSAVSDILQIVAMHLPQGTKPKSYRSAISYRTISFTVLSIIRMPCISRSVYHFFKLGT